jgi:Concanavalin A-like lectin/glucanases superfamily/Dockerin type I domain
MNKLLSSFCLACGTAAVAVLPPLQAQGGVKERVYTFDDVGAVAGQLPPKIWGTAASMRRGISDSQPSTTDYGGVDCPSCVNESFVPMIGSSVETRIPMYANAEDRPGLDSGIGSGNLGLEFDGIDDTLFASKTDSTAPYFFDPRDFNNRFEVLSQAWVKPTATTFPTNQYVWRIGDEHGGIYISTNGKWTFQTANDTPPFQIETGVSVVPNEWTHIALFRGGNSSVLYINGAIVGKDAQFWGHEGPDLRLGSDLLQAAGTFFKGVVDNFSIATLSDEVFDPYQDIDYYQDAGLNFSGMVGDVDQDGNVNNNDYLIWSQNIGFDNGFGAGDLTTLLKGDVNRSGVVDLYDFLIINNASIAAGNGALGLAVPEPTTLALVFTGFALVAVRRTRNRSLITPQIASAALAAAVMLIFSAQSARAELVVAEDFFYDGASKLLHVGGGFNGYEIYQGGQNGPAGTWGGRWQNQGDGIVITPNYVPPGEPPVPEPNTPFYVGDLDGDFFGPNTLLARDFSLAPTVPLTQTLYFGGRFKAETTVDVVPQYYSPRLFLNWIRGEDRLTATPQRDRTDDIALGFQENNLVARLGADSGNLAEEVLVPVASGAPDDGNWHKLIGKLELNVAGGSNERLTVWLDPTGTETGGTSIQFEKDILTDLSELQGTFDSQATAPVDPEDPERGRTYMDDIAIGTTWQDVFTVAVPRLTLKINRANNSATLVNNTSTTFNLSAYSIESVAGSLNPGGWNSLDDQLSGWLENVSTANKLLESNFQDSTPIGPNGQLALGALFTPAATEDLTGRITTVDGLVNLLNVEFVTVAGVDGDYNDDGKVDAADYTVWRNNLGASVTLPHDTSPGTVTPADYTVWKSNFVMSAGSGSVGAGVSSVPEPGSLCILLLAAVIGFGISQRAN